MTDEEEKQVVDETDQEPKVPPQAPPPIQAVNVEERSDRHWLALLIYVLVALLIAVAVVFGARWVYQRYVKEKPASTTPATPAGEAPAKPGSETESQPSGGTTKPPVTSGIQTPSGGQAATPETGPGNVIAIFVGASLAAAALHYIYQLRRAQRN